MTPPDQDACQLYPLAIEHLQDCRPLSCLQMCAGILSGTGCNQQLENLITIITDSTSYVWKLVSWNSCLQETPGEMFLRVGGF